MKFFLQGNIPVGLFPPVMLQASPNIPFDVAQSYLHQHSNGKPAVSASEPIAVPTASRDSSPSCSSRESSPARSAKSVPQKYHPDASQPHRSTVFPDTVAQPLAGDRPTGGAAADGSRPKHWPRSNGSHLAPARQRSEERDTALSWKWYKAEKHRENGNGNSLATVRTRLSSPGVEENPDYAKEEQTLDLEELEQFAKSFKQRRIKLGNLSKKRMSLFRHAKMTRQFL